MVTVCRANGLFLFFLLSTIPLPSSLQEVRTSVDRNTVYEGETVFLIIEADGDTGGETPDIGQLTHDFHIQDSRIEKTAGGKRWVFEIEPKYGGELSIPALRIGKKMRTGAMTITVLAKAVETDGGVSDADVFLEVVADPSDPYVLSQVRYSERLFVAIPLSEGTLSYSPMPQTIMSQALGEEVQYVASRNGRNYRVSERNYSLFPEKSGTITLPPVTFRGRTGQENQNAGQRERFITSGKRIQIQSDAISLNVRARPQQDTATFWLPAVNLTLKETWSVEPLELRVGEPVTRTLSIEAQGLMISQLPELSFADIAGVNSYPDQLSNDTWNDQGWHYSRRDQRIAIVAQAEGVLSLPEVQLLWWDTRADRQRTAILPARTINVLPTAQPPAITVVPEQPDSPDAAGDKPDNAQSAPAKVLAGFWPVASVILLLLWLLTLFAWRYEYQRNNATKMRSHKKTMTNARKLAHQALQQACRRNKAPAAAHALLDWAAARWPEHPPGNLAALAMRLETMREPILALDRVLYSPDAISWRGKTLWRAYKTALTNLPSQKRKPAMGKFPLTPLYPHRGMST